MNAALRSGSLNPATGTAPGRLDFLGGVADYSGSLVLQMPTQARTSITLTPERSSQARFASGSFGITTLDLAPLAALVRKNASLLEFRDHLDENEVPHWARYPLGCFIVLALHSRWLPDSGFFLQISSTVPDGQGVSSSAALEIATLRAFNQASGLGLTAIQLAHLGQQAENLIVGASCGLMDQLASSCGTPGELLPILCRPDTILDPLPLPDGLIIAGWPSGVRHRVGASPYATARAAAFMGKRILETLSGEKWRHASEIPSARFSRYEHDLPASMTGNKYIRLYKDTDDPLTQLEPNRTYPVRAALRFPIAENGRAQRIHEILSANTLEDKSVVMELREILKASHDGYGAMGLGCPETDAFLERVLSERLESGLIGGRISGGGSGGTVVVLLQRRSVGKLRAIASPSPGGAIIF